MRAICHPGPPGASSLHVVNFCGLVVYIVVSSYGIADTGRLCVVTLRVTTCHIVLITSCPGLMLWPEVI